LCFVCTEYSTEIAARFRRPIFHITVLFIDEGESIKRQLLRGEQGRLYNAVVETTGVGKRVEIRKTDLDPELAKLRYRQCKEEVYESLQVIKEKFHFHFINAEGSIQEVQELIVRELQYQSAMELNDDTLQEVRQIPLASDVILNARHEMVKRLDSYSLKHSVLFDRVIQVIHSEFLEIIRRQATSGKAIIRSDNSILQEPLALDMMLDVLAERGYSVVLDYEKPQFAQSVDSAGNFKMKEGRLYEFHISFPRPSIRR